MVVDGIGVEDRWADTAPNRTHEAGERKGTRKYVHAHDGLLLWGLAAHGGGMEKRSWRGEIEEDGDDKKRVDEVEVEEWKGKDEREGRGEEL